MAISLTPPETVSLGLPQMSLRAPSDIPQISLTPRLRYPSYPSAALKGRRDEGYEGSAEGTTTYDRMEGLTKMTETTKSTTNPRSFGSWLNAQAKRDDPVGDLARDVRTDRRHNCMTARTVRGMRRHLVSVHGASFGARSALDRAEAEYEAQCATSSAPTVRSAS